MAKEITKKASKKAAKKTVKKSAIPSSGKPPKYIFNPPYKIDDEFKNLLASLTTEESEILKASLLKDGLREPLIIWKEEKKLVDGHNRHDICMEYPVKKFRTIEKSFTNRDEVKLWIWDNQKGRRNMSPFRRVEAALKLKDIFEEQAREERDKARRRRRKCKDNELACPKLDKPKDKQVHTDKILAGKAKVSRNTFRHAEAIVKKMNAGKIDKKDIDALRSDKKKINTIYLKYCVKKSAVQPSQDLAGRIETTFSTLEKRFAHINRSDFYDRIIAWANDKKAGIDVPSE